MNTDDTKYISEGQQRMLRLIATLAGHEIEGLAPGDIAKLQGCSPSQVTRDLANLKHFGWAEQMPVTARWRLGPDVVRIATRHMTALDRAERRLSEIKSRFGVEAVSTPAGPRMSADQAGAFNSDLVAPGAPRRSTT